MQNRRRKSSDRKEACNGIRSSSERAPHAARPGRPRRNELALRSQRLIETASELFHAHGYANVSLETIACAAHVAVRTIYTTFGNKEGLFLTIVAEARDRFLAQVLDVEDTPGLPLNVLARFGERFLAMATAPDAVRIQRMVIADAIAHPELSRIFYEATAGHVRTMLAEYVARPHVRVLFRADLEPGQLSDHFINCVAADHIKRRLFAASENLPLDIPASVRVGLALFQGACLRVRQPADGAGMVRVEDIFS